MWYLISYRNAISAFAANRFFVSHGLLASVDHATTPSQVQLLERSASK